MNPAFRIDEDVIGKKPSLRTFRTTSEKFFAEHDCMRILGGSVDDGFLYGTRVLEFLLRDFDNTEKHCRKDSILVLHDCVPCDNFIST